MLSTLQPKFFMPVHGEYRHLEEHRRLAEGVGVDAEHVLVAESGSIVELTADDISVVDETDVSNVYVDGLTVGEESDATIRDRQTPCGRRPGDYRCQH